MIATFTDLFFPKKIKNKYLFSTSEISIYIKEHSIEATLFTLKGEDKILTKSWSFDYAKPEELIAHIQTLYSAIPSSTAIKVILESSSLFFKKIDLPFNDYEKIRATLPFELESFLPIPLEEVVLDFVITNYINGIASILVAVIQKKILEEKLRPFTESNISIDYVSIDTIEFYRISSLMIPPSSDKMHIFITVEDGMTKLLLFEGNKFLNVRTLVKRSLPSTSLSDEIIFTINTYCNEQSLTPNALSITIFEKVPSDLIENLNKTFNTECAIFKATDFFKSQVITNASSTDPDTLSYACITTPHGDQEFNINNDVASLKQFIFFQKNIIAICLLSLSVLGLLAFHIFTQTSYLQKRLNSDQNKIIAVMKKTFPSVEEELTRLAKKSKTSKKSLSAARQISEALTLAHKDISQESSILSAFSPQNRNSFLEYLVALSTKIDRESLGLELKKMVLNKNVITLEGKVRNFEALEQFEKALKETQLFSAIPDMQKVDFSISLPLEQKGALS